MILTNAFLAERLIYCLGWTLLHSLWQALILALLIAACTALLPRLSARSQYHLCLGGLLAVGGASALSFTHYWDATAPLAVLHTYSLAALWGDAQRITQPGWITNQLKPIVIIWALGCGATAARHIWAYVLSRRLITGAGTAPTHLAARLELLRARAGIRQPVRLGLHPTLSTPCVIGWLKPWILLPAAAVARLPAEELEAAIAHELWHIKRHDYPVQLLQAVMKTLFFFNPATLWLSRRTDWLREQACDDGALQLAAKPAALAGALAYFAGVSRAPAAANLIQPRFATLERIKRIMAPPAPRCRRLEALAASAGAVLLGAVLSVNAAQKDDFAKQLETIPLGPFQQLTDGEARELIRQGLRDILDAGQLVTDLPTWQSNAIAQLPVVDRRQLNTALLELLRPGFEASMRTTEFYRQISPAARAEAMEALFDNHYARALALPAKQLVAAVPGNTGAPIATLEQFGTERAYKMTLTADLLTHPALAAGHAGFRVNHGDKYLITFALHESALRDSAADGIDYTQASTARPADSWTFSSQSDSSPGILSAFASQQLVQVALDPELYQAVLAGGLESFGSAAAGLRRDSDGSLAIYLNVDHQQRFSRRIVPLLPDSSFKPAKPAVHSAESLNALPEEQQQALLELAEQFVAAQQWLAGQPFGPQHAAALQEVIIASYLRPDTLRNGEQAPDHFNAYPPAGNSLLAYGPAGGQVRYRAREKTAATVIAELEALCGAPIAPSWKSADQRSLNVYLEEVPCARLEGLLEHIQWK